MRRTSWWGPLVCLALGACTSLQGGARVSPWPSDPPSSGFPGIINVSDGRAQPQRRFVFNIHGMGCTRRDYNDGLVSSLRRYGFTQALTSTPLLAEIRESIPDDDANCDGVPDRERQRDLVGWFDIPLARSVNVRGEGLDCDPADTAPPCRYTTFGSLRVDRLTHGAEELFIYTHYWHDDFWALQRRYLTADIRQGERALINGVLKRELMDRGFSDAVAYLGPLGELARESIRTSVCVMLWHASSSPQVAAVPASGNCLDRSPPMIPESVEFSFISHSLGSRMLFDALSADPYQSHLADGAETRSANERIAVQRLADRTRVVYMAANQMPLLGLGSVRLSNAQRTADVCAAETFIYCRSQGLDSPPLHVVGFYDPDDILGFRADGGMVRAANAQAEAYGLRFTNVRHRNATQWLWILSWPGSAHDQELNRESSRRLILCGANVDGDGHLTPQLTGCVRGR